MTLNHKEFDAFLSALKQYESGRFWGGTHGETAIGVVNGLTPKIVDCGFLPEDRAHACIQAAYWLFNAWKTFHIFEVEKEG